MTVPVLKVEIRSPGATGSWLDITSSVLISTPVTITRGRENERAVASPATCSLTLDNAAGGFTEGILVSGVKWGRWTQLRVSVNGQRRFTGVVSGLDQDWPAGASNRAAVRVTASGMKTYMAASPNLKPWIGELIEEESPVFWWPLDEPPYAAAGRNQASIDPSFGALPMAARTWVAGDGVAASGWAFGAASPPWLEGDTMVSLTPTIELDGSGNATKLVATTPDSHFSGALNWTILFVHQPNFAAPHHGRVPILGVNNQMSTDAVVLERDGSAVWLRKVDRVTGATLSSVSVGRIEDGVPRLWGLVFTSGPAVRVAGTSAAVTGGVFIPSSVCLGAPWVAFPLTSQPLPPDAIASGLYGHIAVVPSAIADSKFASLRNMIEGGVDSDLVWLRRAAGYTGLQAEKAGPSRPIRRPNLRGSNPAAIGDLLAAATNGDFVEDRDGIPTLVDHRYVPTQPVVPTIHLDAVDAGHLRWSSDPTLRVTEAGRGERIQASRTGFPRVRRQIDDGLPLADAQRLADWLVNSSEVAEAPRLTGIKLDLLAGSPSDVALWEPLAYLLRPRIRIDVASVPPQLAGLTIRTMTVEGTTEVVSGDEWSLLLSTAPDPRLILADPVQGVLGYAAGNRLGN